MPQPRLARAAFAAAFACSTAFAQAYPAKPIRGYWDKATHRSVE